MMKLYIGNKNYSSWSMRPWVLLREAGIAFEEVLLRFDGFEPDSAFKAEVTRLSPAGRVPVLEDDGLVVWDTLAIAEYLAEKFSTHRLWPEEPRQRARARSVCAEMHAGFSALRSHLPMNIEASLPEVGARVLLDQEAVRTDLARLEQMWGELLSASGGPLLFGRFTIADAYFAPVVMRMLTYGVPASAEVRRYVDSVSALPSVQAWRRDALDEHDFRPFEEPYRASP